MASVHKSFTSCMKLALFLVVVAVAVAVASSDVQQNVAAMGRTGNRFLLDTSTAGGGRRSLLNYNACGSGSAPDYECKKKFPGFKNASCCTQADNSKQCYDVGAYLNNMCGSCNTKCAFGTYCCSGVCVNFQSNANNCGFCGNKCKNNLPCKGGMCGYGEGKEHD